VLHILPSGFSTGPWHQLHLSARTREQLVLQCSAVQRRGVYFWFIRSRLPVSSLPVVGAVRHDESPVGQFPWKLEG